MTLDLQHCDDGLLKEDFTNHSDVKQYKYHQHHPHKILPDEKKPQKDGTKQKHSFDLLDNHSVNTDSTFVSLGTVDKSLLSTSNSDFFSAPMQTTDHSPSSQNQKDMSTELNSTVIEQRSNFSNTMFAKKEEECLVPSKDIIPNQLNMNDALSLHNNRQVDLKENSMIEMTESHENEITQCLEDMKVINDEDCSGLKDLTKVGSLLYTTGDDCRLSEVPQFLGKENMRAVAEHDIQQTYVEENIESYVAGDIFKQKVDGVCMGSNLDAIQSHNAPDSESDCRVSSDSGVVSTVENEIEENKSPIKAMVVSGSAEECKASEISQGSASVILKDSKDTTDEFPHILSISVDGDIPRESKPCTSITTEDDNCSGRVKETITALQEKSEKLRGIDPATSVLPNNEHSYHKDPTTQPKTSLSHSSKGKDHHSHHKHLDKEHHSRSSSSSRHHKHKHKHKHRHDDKETSISKGGEKKEHKKSTDIKLERSASASSGSTHSNKSEKIASKSGLSSKNISTSGSGSTNKNHSAEKTTKNEKSHSQSSYKKAEDTKSKDIQSKSSSSKGKSSSSNEGSSSSSSSKHGSSSKHSSSSRHHSGSKHSSSGSNKPISSSIKTHTGSSSSSSKLSSSTPKKTPLKVISNDMKEHTPAEISKLTHKVSDKMSQKSSHKTSHTPSKHSSQVSHSDGTPKRKKSSEDKCTPHTPSSSSKNKHSSSEASAKKRKLEFISDGSGDMKKTKMDPFTSSNIPTVQTTPVRTANKLPSAPNFSEVEHFLYPTRKLNPATVGSELEQMLKRQALSLKNNIRPDNLFNVVTHCNGGGLVLELEQDHLDTAVDPAHHLDIARNFLDILFREENNASRFTMGIVRGGARYLPDYLEYMAIHHPDLSVKQTALGSKSDLETLTASKYRDLVHKSYCAGTFRTGGMNHISLVGAKQEEAGDYYPEMLDMLEQSPFLKLTMPWGEVASVHGLPRSYSNDGPILWIRPGEQMVPTAEISKSPFKKRR